MCGIVGLFDTTGRQEIDRGLLTRMNDSHVHRGPDGDGEFFDPGIGLGHRRLSIIDLSGGAQPLFNEDGNVVVVFNGEIYNFQDLSDELIEAGHTFRTRSDTEVIVHAWEEWGQACVDRFRGMFTFAIWDRRKETLFLARDRLGIKPLYYSVLPSGMLIFGSELKSLLVHPELERKLDPQAVEEYFAYGYVPDPKTIYSGVNKLAPGHLLKWRRGEGQPRPHQYWDINFDPSDHRSEEDVCEDLIEQLREAVKLRMIADVPLGAFLSGGVDSSAVVAMMAGEASDPVNTCSIAFADPKFDESPYARIVADRFGTNHFQDQVDPDAFDLVDRLANMYDEPFADSSAMPTYRVCGLARQRVKVALSGDGGDEIFAGYRRYRWHDYEERVRGVMPDAIRKPLFGFLGAAYPKMDWAPKPLRAKSTFQALSRDTVGGFFHSVSVLYDGVRQPIYSDAFRSELQGYHARDVLDKVMAKAPSDDHTSRVQYADLKTYLPGDILTKVDRASMAQSLEVRVPILDHKFVEWSARLPSSVKLNGREGKHIFKKALEPHLGNDILYRSKMGFSVPLGAWFRGPLKDRVGAALSGPVLADTGLFDMSQLRTIMDQHQSGAREHSAVMWAVLMFESFLRQVHNSDPAPQSEQSAAPA